MTQEDTPNDEPGTLEKLGGAFKSAGLWVLGWFKAYLLALILLSITIVGLLEFVGISTGVPNALSNYVVYFAFGNLIGVLPAIGIYYWLVHRRGIPLRDVYSATGDTGAYLIPPERWEEITVEAPHSINENGDVTYEQVSKSQLHTIDTKYGVGYECTQYDPETLTARISWMAGSSPSEIRAFKKEIRKVKTKLSILADLGIEESIERTPIVRQITQKLARYLVMCHQKGTLPNGGEIQGVVESVLDQQVSGDWSTLDDKIQERMPDEYDNPDTSAGKRIYDLRHGGGGE